MTRPTSMQSSMRARPTRRALGALVALLLIAIASAAGCIRDEDLTLEQRQHQLERELMCPVCDGQTLDQSQAQISQDMKGVIAEKLVAGETNGRIKEYFVERYGEQVLASPAAGGLNLLAWLMPFAIAAGGVAIVFFALRGMRRPAGQLRTAQLDRTLEPYLDQVDMDLGLSASSTSGGRGSRKGGDG